MSDKELLEMISILMKMSTDTYEKCKYMTLAYEKQHKTLDTMAFLVTLFNLVDNHRPKLLEI